MGAIEGKTGDVVRRIVEAVHPLQIILFGSAARGTATASSDLDLLVVMPDGTHRRQTAQAIYERIWGVGIPVDVVVATPSDLAKNQNTIGLVYGPALRDGLEVYTAGSGETG